MVGNVGIDLIPAICCEKFQIEPQMLSWFNHSNEATVFDGRVGEGLLDQDGCAFANHRQREHPWCYGLTWEVTLIYGMPVEHQNVEPTTVVLRFNLI